MEENIQELKPMNIGIILDKVFRLTFNKKFFMIFGISCIFFIPLIILKKTGLIFISLHLENVTLLNNSASLYAVKFVIGLLPVIPLVFICGIYSDFFYRKLINNEWELKNSFNFIKSLFKPLIIYLIMLYTVDYFLKDLFFKIIITNFLSGNYSEFMPYISLIFRILQTALLLIILTFASPVLSVIIFENKKILQAINKSSLIIKKSFFRTFGSIVLYYFIIQFINFIILFIFRYVYFFLDHFFLNKLNFISRYDNYIESTFAEILSIFFIGYIIAYITLLYINYKIKHENFGIQLLAESMINNEEGN